MANVLDPREVTSKFGNELLIRKPNTVLDTTGSPLVPSDIPSGPEGRRFDYYTSQFEKRGLENPLARTYASFIMSFAVDDKDFERFVLTTDDTVSLTSEGFAYINYLRGNTSQIGIRNGVPEPKRFRLGTALPEEVPDDYQQPPTRPDLDFDYNTEQKPIKPRYGLGTVNQTSFSFYETLTELNSTNRAGEFTLSAGRHQKMYYVYPAAYGFARFIDVDSGFEGGWDGAQYFINLQRGPVTVTYNIAGKDVDFFIYETDYQNLGLANWRVL